MFDIDHLKIDPEKSEEGVWVDYLRGSSLKVSRANNKEAENFRFQKAIEFADIFNAGGEEAEKKAFEVETETMAYFILRDWDGIERAGKELKYTPKTGMTLLADPMMQDFREDVMRIARNREHYRAASEEAAVESVKDTAAS